MATNLILPGQIGAVGGVPDLASLQAAVQALTLQLQQPYKNPQVLAQAGAPSSVTGTVSPTTLASILIPAGTVSANGKIRLYMVWSWTNNANNKTLQVQLGGFNVLNSLVVTTNNSLWRRIDIYNQGIQNSQFMQVSNSAASDGVMGAITTSSIDLTSTQSLNFIGTLASAADTLTLNGYTVEILNP